MKRIIRTGLLLVCSIVILLPSNAVYAFDQAFFNGNDILYYNPDACSVNTPSSITGSGTVAPYTNPVYKNSAPDPAAISGPNGMFYVYATGGELLESKDMSNWKKIDSNWKLKGAPNEAGGAKWAPDVVKVDSRYILTYTIPTGTPEYSGGGSPKIAYAVGDTPGGEFTYQGKLDLPYAYSIDSHIFADDNGRLWLFWGGGEIHVIELTFNGKTLNTKGSSRKLLTKGGVGSSATIEGAWVIKRNGWYYLTYSQGHYKATDGAPEYRVLVARSKTVNGNYTPSNSMKPILEGKAPITFPGHHSIITDNASNDWMVYHGYFKGEKNTRSLNIDPITYDNDGWPVVNKGKGPSSTQQPGSPAASTPSAATGSSSVDSSISVFGDSLTVGMKNKGGLNKKLTDDGWKVETIEAEGGENIAWARERLKVASVKKSVSDSDTILIAMGTNADDNPKKQVEGIIKELRDIKPDINIYWVNIFTPRDNAYRDNMNAILESKSGSLGFNVIDWHTEVKDKTDYYQFIPNNIHHTDLGYERKSEFVVKSFNDPPVESVTPPTTSDIAAAGAVCCSEQGARSIASADVKLAGGDNAEKIFNFLTGADENKIKISTNNNKPLNAIQAAAFVGNFAQESSLDPKVVNSIGATGIAQWLGGRKDALMKLSNPLTLGTQLQFIKAEIEGAEKAIMSHSDFQDATNIDAATVAVRKTYERPGEAEANDANRIKVARKVLEEFGGGTPTTTGTTTDSTSDSSGCGSDSPSGDLGPGSGDFTDSGEISGWNITKENSILTDKEFGDSMVNEGHCAAIVSRVFSGNSFGNWNNGRWGTTNAYAISMWYQYYKTSTAHADRNPKKGAWLFYEHKSTSAGDAGHIVIYLGDNKVLNDGNIVNADYIEKDWGMKYLGWIDPTEAGFTAKKQTASQLHGLLDGYR